jgi:hypothetical protein
VCVELNLGRLFQVHGAICCAEVSYYSRCFNTNTCSIPTQDTVTQTEPCVFVPDSAGHSSDHSKRAEVRGDWLQSEPGWLEATGTQAVSAVRCKGRLSPRTPGPVMHKTV